MTLFRIYLIVILSRGLGLASTEGCYYVSSEMIYARDLAVAVPEFAGLPPDLELGFAPAPGAERVLHAIELRYIAQKNKLPTTGINGSVCVGWEMKTLPKDRILEAMQRTLAGHKTEIEIVDQSKAATPPGIVYFSLGGLSATSDKPVIWNGYVAYAPNRKFSTWALVRLRISEKHLVALRSIRKGDSVEPGYFRDEAYDGPFPKEIAIAHLPESTPLVAAREITEGATLYSSMVTQAEDVQRGDLVTVIVDSGAAHLEVQGLATQGGVCGDVILVKNVRSGRLFKSRVAGKRRVVVEPSALYGLTGEEKKS